MKSVKTNIENAQARVVVVFDELSRHAPNVAGAQEDEVVERVFA
jgi:hypothetical protein